MDWGEEKSDLEKLAEKSDLEKLAESPGVINLAKRIKEDLNLSRVTVELLDSLFCCDAEKHFRAVDTIWRDGQFFDLLCKESDKSRHLVHGLAGRMNETRSDLFELRGEDVRLDPYLSTVLKLSKPVERMSGALSILIGYWCLEFKLEDYFTGDLGLYALGIETISCDCKSQGKTKTKSEPSTKRDNSGEIKVVAKQSTIRQLIQVPSISRLAEEIIGSYPRIVKVADRFLNSLALEVVCSCAPGSHNHEFHSDQRYAVRAFWRNKEFCGLLLNHIIEDPCLLAVVKIFSYRSTREIALLHTKFISQLYDSKPIFTNQNFDLEEKIRLALAILFEHWTCMGVLMKVREHIGYHCSHPETTKEYAEFKDQPIGEVFYRSRLKNPSHAALSLTNLITPWSEENQTKTTCLFEKDFSYVLTDGLRDGFRPDESMFIDLLDKINSVRADSRMRIKVKCDGPVLSMTCSF